MVPYFEARTLRVGGLPLAVFGILVSAGVFAGAIHATSRARAVGISERDIHGAIAWAVVPGFLVAHLAAVAPRVGSGSPSGPWMLVEFWNGMSAFGGLAGAFLGLAWWHRRQGPAQRLAVAEVLVQGLVVGWVFGRLGCTLVHDHVGRPSTFWLAIAFPGGPRHDLGFYELLYTTLVLLPAVIVLNRRPRPPGATIAWLALLYAPARFLGDFLRNGDLPGADGRYLGLTLAQYGCVVLAGVGVAFTWRREAGGAARAGAPPRSGLTSR